MLFQGLYVGWIRGTNEQEELATSYRSTCSFSQLTGPNQNFKKWTKPYFAFFTILMLENKEELKHIIE